MADPLQPSTLLVGLIGGAGGSVFTAWIGYMVQNKLAARRREEKENSLAYVSFVKISAIVATTQIMREGPPTAMAPTALRDMLSAITAAHPGMTEAHATCALLSVMLTHEANDALGVDGREMIGHMMSFVIPQYERISSDFEISPSQLAEMPRSAVGTHSLLVAGLSAFGSVLTMLKEYASGGSDELVSAQSLYGYWGAFHFMERKAEELRKELMTHAKLKPEEADQILATQKVELGGHMPDFIEAQEHLNAATNAIKPILDAQFVMALAMAKMSSGTSSDSEDTPVCPE